ncbi:hypothetical protein BD560DRAFT_320240 [Blakeslea trispora]|nr:hypothetical protein BD560DRAFT_320240 [Blakeslea trispora]
MPETVDDLIFFFLNSLPTHCPRFFRRIILRTIRWPNICKILFKLDCFQHPKIPPSPPNHLGQQPLD